MTNTNTYMSAVETWNDEFIDLSSKFSEKIGPSQQGEDGLIDKIFTLCKPKNKWCVECGAGDGYNLSNTWYLINKKGWNGILIENNPITYSEMIKLYKNNQNVYPIYSKLTETNFQDTLSKYRIPKDFDFLSIDIDSCDYEVWENLTEYKPNVVVIEIDPFEHDFSVISKTPPMRNDGRVGGYSVGKLLALAKQKGYDFICANICNAFFIKNDFGKEIRTRIKKVINRE